MRWLTRKSDKPDKMGSVTDELAKEVSALFEGEIVKPGMNSTFNYQVNRVFLLEPT